MGRVAVSGEFLFMLTQPPRSPNITSPIAPYYQPKQIKMVSQFGSSKQSCGLKLAYGKKTAPFRISLIIISHSSIARILYSYLRCSHILGWHGIRLMHLVLDLFVRKWCFSLSLEYCILMISGEAVQFQPEEQSK